MRLNIVMRANVQIENLLHSVMAVPYIKFNSFQLFFYSVSSFERYEIKKRIVTKIQHQIFWNANSNSNILQPKKKKIRNIVVEKEFWNMHSFGIIVFFFCFFFYSIFDSFHDTVGWINWHISVSKRSKSIYIFCGVCV